MGIRIAGLIWIAACWCALSAPASAEESGARQILSQIREVYRSRAIPPFVSYSITRDQLTEDGAPDLLWSYTYHVWFRTADRAAMGRKRFRGRYLNLEFMRPAFNEPRDPGPPTADLFERAPAHPQFGMTPFDVPSSVPQIGSVTAYADTDYRVSGIKTEGTLFHLWLTPMRDEERNRLRELWADRQTFELQKVVATDRLYVLGGPSFPMTDTITMGQVAGHPVVTDIHGRTNFDDEAFGAHYEVDYHFRDVSFPQALPDWYFEPPTYGEHIAEAPQ